MIQMLLVDVQDLWIHIKKIFLMYLLLIQECIYHVQYVKTIIHLYIEIGQWVYLQKFNQIIHFLLNILIGYKQNVI